MQAQRAASCQTRLNWLIPTLCHDFGIVHCMQNNQSLESQRANKWVYVTDRFLGSPNIHLHILRYHICIPSPDLIKQGWCLYPSQVLTIPFRCLLDLKSLAPGNWMYMRQLIHNAVRLRRLLWRESKVISVRDGVQERQRVLGVNKKSIWESFPLLESVFCEAHPILEPRLTVNSLSLKNKGPSMGFHDTSYLCSVHVLTAGASKSPSVKPDPYAWNIPCTSMRKSYIYYTILSKGTYKEMEGTRQDPWSLHREI